MTTKEYKKNFYQKTLKLALPLSLQSFLSSAMGIVDMMMVSAIGMVTAVGTADQIQFLCQIVMYGVASGTGIFASQFYGAGDNRNLKRAFGLSVALAFLNAVFWFLITHFFARELLYFYLPDNEVIYYSVKYLNIIKYSMLLSSVSFAFSFIYRSIHLPKVAVTINSISMILNVIFNLILIPLMGIEGAALATLGAQIIRFIIYVVFSKSTNQPFIGTMKEMFSFDKEFIFPIIQKTLPLLLNETLFGFGMTMFAKLFGMLGKESMDAYYVGNQIYNMFLFAVYGFGGAISVLVGSRLGEGKVEQAKMDVREYLKLSLMMSIIIVGLMILFAKPMIQLFNINDPSTFLLATQVVSILSIKSALRLFNFVSFSILRAGGDTKMIQFLDSGLVWLVGIPLVYICVNLLGITSLITVLVIVQLEQVIRMIGALSRVIGGKWAKNVTGLVER